MHIVTTLLMVVVWGGLGILSEYPDLVGDVGLQNYLPPNIKGDAMQVIGGVIFVALLDFLISSIIFDAKGHVDGETHSKMVKKMIELREENTILRSMVQGDGKKFLLVHV